MKIKIDDRVIFDGNYFQILVIVIVFILSFKLGRFLCDLII